MMPERRNMKVFCVSNKLFAEHRNGDDEWSEAYVELSGIPELRSYCRSILADAQKSQAAQYLRIDVPAAISSADLWVSGAFDQESKRKASLVKKELSLVQERLKEVSEFRRYYDIDFSCCAWGLTLSVGRVSNPVLAESSHATILSSNRCFNVVSSAPSARNPPT